MHRNQRLNRQIGFTLIEMLVVLVILALTTSLMTQGLSTTWRNFERLGARDLMNASAQLPQSWFEQSVKGAVLYHPYKPSVIGDAVAFEFITFNSPNDDMHIPQKILWHFEVINNRWHLGFSNQGQTSIVYVASFESRPIFEYLTNQLWQSEFKPKDGQLPLAVRIIYKGNIWGIAKVGRPEFADMPPELARYDEYEF